ncbi:SPOR domain-containing protein [Marinomonas mediterranea]|jgi:Cell division protein|uniref:Sporulation domain-containing protein n=1 Tax=Marinomonas mediterranea (strain ATCC 700492 / JCM 21426 / NBRC 103028 / MMB-1) TaxID=717774 RepID=F2JWS7_MARM1|nr:SPOR domain-containing protein [Marinomonas mediterranea]ADZ92944.1 Sporulation domain-containing protein [Marinomonas mediterranea MMB-1]WCN18965.1 SPOR domain-containing protein [Marinomonas mediterranea MMB-1]
MAAKGSRPRKGATRKAATPPPKRKTSWWMWLIVPAIVFGFIYGLMQLSQVEQTTKPQTQVKTQAPTKSTSTPAKAEQKPKVVESQKKPVETAKRAEKDKFEFYQILQDSEVDTSHVDAYEYEPRGEQDFLYMLQAASFRSSTDADRLRAELILSGLPAAIRETTGENGAPWYRVTVGPYLSRSEKSRAQDKLVAKGIESYTYKIPRPEGK